MEKQKKKVRTYSANDNDVAMLESVANYHGFSKSGMIVGLVKREFWRIFPGGTDGITPDPNAMVKDSS